MIYNMYLFDRNGECLYYGEWNRPNTRNQTEEEEFKLMYGMIFSLRSFVGRLSPIDMKEGFLSYATDKYKLHYHETPTGLKFIMNTSVKVPNMQETLQQIYSQIYVQYVIKNPVSDLSKPITSELFKDKLDKFVKDLPCYS